MYRPSGAEPARPPAFAWTLSVPAKHGASSVVRIDAALRSAQKARAPVLIDFFADWCGACRVLERELLTDPEVIRAAARFVTIRIDVTDEDDVAAALSARFGVTVLPTIVFVDGIGAAMAEPVRGLVDRAGLLRRLRAVPASRG